MDVDVVINDPGSEFSVYPSARSVTVEVVGRTNCIQIRFDSFRDARMFASEMLRAVRRRQKQEQKVRRSA